MTRRRVAPAGSVRVGIGVDQHAVELTPGRPLVLAGIVIPGAPGLRAHSDGDVVLHAVFNAISSGLGNRSIGWYHSDRDERRRGAASCEYLKTTRAMLDRQGFVVGNLAAAIECKAPRIEPHVPAMKKSLARLLDCPAGAIGITASTGEGLSAYGQGRGILVQAVVTLVATPAPPRRRVG